MLTLPKLPMHALLQAPFRLGRAEETDLHRRLVEPALLLALAGEADSALVLWDLAYSPGLWRRARSSAYEDSAIVAVSDATGRQVLNGPAASSDLVNEWYQWIRERLLTDPWQGKALPEADLAQLDATQLHRTALRLLETGDLVTAREALELLLEQRSEELPTYVLANAQLIAADLCVRVGEHETAVQRLEQWCRRGREYGSAIVNDAFCLAPLVPLILQGALRDALGVAPDQARAAANEIAAAARERLGGAPRLPGPVAERGWRGFLETFSAALASMAAAEGEELPEADESGWLGNDPATEDELRRAEERLGGIRLPTSYRDFLLTSNGWRFFSDSVPTLRGTGSIAWFRDENLEWVEAWTSGGRVEGLEGWSAEANDEEYLVYGDEQDSVTMRERYLSSTLQISDVGDAAVILLNPEVQDAEGEWEAWFHATWLPGAQRHRSFRELMESEFEAVLQRDLI